MKSVKCGSVLGQKQKTVEYYISNTAEPLNMAWPGDVLNPCQYDPSTNSVYVPSEVQNLFSWYLCKTT
jgi:hypothetical protein